MYGGSRGAGNRGSCSEGIVDKAVEISMFSRDIYCAKYCNRVGGGGVRKINKGEKEKEEINICTIYTSVLMSL